MFNLKLNNVTQDTENYPKKHVFAQLNRGIVPI